MMASCWEKALPVPNHMGRAGESGTKASQCMWPLGSDGCFSHLSLQKMLMKQQDRLEEREQDIEEQLYKLESDKRLVEVTGPSPFCGQPRGLSPHGAMGTGSQGVGARWAGRREDTQGKSGWPDLLSPFLSWQSYFWEMKCVWGCPTASWVLM